MKTKFLMLGMILSFMTISCTKKEDDQDNVTITFDEAKVNNKIDVAVDEVAKTIEDEVEATQKSTVDAPEARPADNCPTITRIPAFGAILVPGQAVSKTIDFGTACVNSNNNVLRGKIIINYIYQPDATTRVVTYSFDNFFHNLRQLNGSKTFTRTMTPTGPKVVMNMDLTLTLSSGQTVRREGSRTRIQTAGFSTIIDLSDNVYQVTGDWTTTYPNNSIQTSTITTPLIVKLACLPTNSPIASGVITFVRNGKTATLDYGNGVCDKLAVFTYKGVSFNLMLGTTD